MNTETKLKRLFDYQKFEKNPRLARIIDEAESGGEALSDNFLSFVNAAGEFSISGGTIDNNKAKDGAGTYTPENDSKF